MGQRTFSCDGAHPDCVNLEFMTKKSLALASFFALTIGLTACEDNGGEITPAEENEANDETTVEETEEDVPETEAEPEPDAEDDNGETAQSQDYPNFGDTWTWDDGLSVTLSEPAPYEPSYEEVTEYDQAIVFEVTVENGTGSEYDPSMIMLSASSGGQEADTAYDSANGLEGAPSTTMLDGQSTTFQYGFGVADPDDVTVEIQDFDFDRQSVIFVSQ